MATEITCVVPHRLRPGQLDALGGPGWQGDVATVIGEIEAGREYYLRRGDARLGVRVVRDHGRRRLRTDPRESPSDALLSLPSCAA